MPFGGSGVGPIAVISPSLCPLALKWKSTSRSVPAATGEERRMPDLSPTRIDSALNDRLGQIVMRFSSPEYCVTALLAKLLQADHGGMMLITTNISVAQQNQVGSWDSRASPRRTRAK
jgi:hypothetical protein